MPSTPNGSKPALLLRGATPDELNLIRHDWFLSFRREMKPSPRPDIYSLGQNVIIDRLIAAFPPIVATLESVPEEVIGWACREFDRSVTHYCYVKHAYRRRGVATVLTANTLQHSHHTRAGELLARRVMSLYNPYLLSHGATHV